MPGKKTRSLLIAIAISICSVLITVLCVEVVFYFLQSKSNDGVYFICKGKNVDTMCTSDRSLGYKMWPNEALYVVKAAKTRVVFNARYTTDEYSRRVTPVKNRKDRANNILFFGCSYVLGEGLNDDETLPFYVSQYAPSYMPYNYGCIGYGPQQMLAKLQNYKLANEIENAGSGDTICVYSFAFCHISRAVGSLRIYRMWGKEMPYYTCDDKGMLVRKSSFRDGRPFRSLVYDILGNSQFVKYYLFNPDWNKCRDYPPKITANDIELTFRIVQESEKIFMKEFKNGRFYVLLLPFEENDPRIIAHLKKIGIKYLDFAGLVDMNRRDNYISEYDRHPTAAVYRRVAAKLVEDLGIGAQ